MKKEVSIHILLQFLQKIGTVTLFLSAAQHYHLGMLKSIDKSILITFSLLLVIKEIKGVEICTTQTCISVADQISQFMDPTADPCDDFNQFSCGGYVEEANATDSYGSPWGDSAAQMEDRIERLIKIEKERPTDFEVDRKVRNFYNACEKFRNQLEMVSNAVPNALSNAVSNALKLKKIAADVKKTLDSIGLNGWPYSYNTEDFRLYDVIPKMIQEGLVFTDGRIELPIINVDVGVNDVTKTENILKIDSPDFDDFVSEWSSYKEDEEHYTEVHYTSPKAILKILNPSIDLSTQLVLNRSLEIHAGLGYIANINNQIHRFWKNNREYGLLESNLKETTVSNLPPLSCGTTSNTCKPPTWEEYLNSLFQASGNVHVKIDSNKRLLVKDPEYFDKLNTKLNELQIQPYEMKNYIGWKVLVDYIVGAKNFQSAFKGKCVKYLLHGRDNNPYAKNGLLNLAVASMYVREYVDIKKKKDVTKMVNQIRKTFKLLLPRLDWMDEHTKKNAIEKFEAMGQFVGYPEELRQKSTIDQYYKGIKISIIFINLLRYNC